MMANFRQLLRRGGGVGAAGRANPARRRVALEPLEARQLMAGGLTVVGPFNVSRNDKPTNGMALCPNHHWAMDRHLIAPVPDIKKRAGVWRVNDHRLDDRIEGQRDLVAIAGKAVIPPSEEKFYPALESLRWREEHLDTAY